MKKRAISAIIGLHILFIFLQIHKQSTLIELSYQKQKQEKLKQELINKKNELKRTLCLLQDPETVRAYAQVAGMKKISLSQIKRLPS